MKADAVTTDHEATRVAACRELLDRAYGKASQPVEAQVQVGMSAELERLLQQCDGQSRSIPTANGNLLPAPQVTKYGEIWDVDPALRPR